LYNLFTKEGQGKDVSYMKHYKEDALKDLALLRRGNRLSVMPVTAEQWNFIVGLEQRNPVA